MNCSVYNKRQEGSFIFQNIFIGNIDDANNYEWLKRNNITHVLGVVDYQQKFNDINYLVFPRVDDDPSQNIAKYFSRSFRFIEDSVEKNGNVLVHCHAGISRSSTIVIAYLMYKYSVNLEKAFEMVKRARCMIAPNQGFINQLRAFDRLTTYEQRLFFDF